jgi:hypothetical protein
MDRRLKIVLALIGTAILGYISGVHGDQKAKERKKQDAITFDHLPRGRSKRQRCCRKMPDYSANPWPLMSNEGKQGMRHDGIHESMVSGRGRW